MEEGQEMREEERTRGGKFALIISQNFEFQQKIYKKKRKALKFVLTARKLKGLP